MPNLDDANDFLFGGGAKAFPFENIGDFVAGEITAMKKQQQTDMQSGDPAFWANGEPKMMLRIELQTQLHDAEDDEGMRSVYLRGGNFIAVKGSGTSSLLAVKDAVRKAQAPNGIEIGGWLSMTFSGLGQSSSKGFNPPKLYVAQYRAPSFAVDLNELA